MICKDLTNVEGLAMNEVVGLFKGKKVGPTFFQGSSPIDGVWTTLDITIANECIMPVGYGTGDHCIFIIDIMASDIIGYNYQKIARLLTQWLIMNLPGVSKKYNAALEEKVLEHQII